MYARHLARFFDVNCRVIDMHTGDLGQEESLRRPEPAGNCLNWVLGHVLVNRDTVLRLLGAEAIWTAQETAAYARGTDGVLAEDAALPLADLRARLERSQQVLLDRLDAATEEQFAAPSGHESLGSVGEAIGFLQFHETYHTGQLALLRRLLGKDGVIR